MKKNLVQKFISSKTAATVLMQNMKMKGLQNMEI